ncbi:MAG: hypothetical protein M1834_008762 [Cirrosporium novae-zelandiae]|nr:MAG: hypothetical protein M1834_008762 [Cirrosporium novae-zelandiae]
MPSENFIYIVNLFTIPQENDSTTRILGVYRSLENANAFCMKYLQDQLGISDTQRDGSDDNGEKFEIYCHQGMVHVYAIDEMLDVYQVDVEQHVLQD